MGNRFKELAEEFSLIRLVGKKPREKKWQRYCWHKRSFEEIGFREGDNVGICAGPGSGIIAIDVDDPIRFNEVSQKNGWILPETRKHETGTGKPHYLFKYPNSDKEYRNRSFNNLGFDIRGLGGQIVAPGSIHPETGRSYKITNNAPIADPPQWLLSLYDKNENVHILYASKVKIDIKTLPISKRTKKLITKNIPVGQRSEGIMTVLTALSDAGITDDEIIDIFETYPIGEKYREKGEIRVNWLQPQIEKARNWVKSTKLKIDAEVQDLSIITSEAWKALLKYNNPPVIFYHASGIVCISRDANGKFILSNVGKDRLRYFLARAAYWYQMKKKKETAALPPIYVCQDMIACPDPPLPKLEMLIYHPLFSEDGSLHIMEGYSEKTKCYFAKSSGLTIPKVPDKPTQAGIARAKERIEDLLSDFPFTTNSEKAHSISLCILPFVRPMINGPTPFHLIEAPTPGTGKTLLANCLSHPSSGGEVIALTEGRDDEEWRKRITSALRKQSSYLLVDNIQRKIDSSALASALTRTIWTDRILGHSNTISVPINCAWIATANNPVVSPEIARRTIRIRLDARTEKPWLRPNNNFRYPNLPKWVEENRGELIWAALILVQSWIIEGRPRPEGIIPLGMFESWSNVIGGILQVANIPGFLENLDEFYESTDDEDPALKLLIRHWWTMHESRSVGVAELFNIIETFDIPLEIGGGDSERGQKISLGKYLQRIRDRQIDGNRIVPGRIRHNTQQWKLEPSPSLTRGAGAVGLEGGGFEISPENPHEISKQNQPIGEKGDIGDVFKTDEKIENIPSSGKNSESKTNSKMVEKNPPHPHSDEDST